MFVCNTLLNGHENSKIEYIQVVWIVLEGEVCASVELWLFSTH